MLSVEELNYLNLPNLFNNLQVSTNNERFRAPYPIAGVLLKASSVEIVVRLRNKVLT